MFYQEKIIDGFWHMKSTPDGKWRRFNEQNYISKILRLEKEIKNLKEQAND